MKKIFMAFICLTLSAYARSQSGHFIHVINNMLVDSSGKRIYLNGVNLGGWLLWEGWIMGGGFQKESKIKEGIKQLLGEQEYRDFIKKYYENFITEKDIALIAGNGFNSIRVPFNYRLFSQLENDGVDGFAILDNLIRWCKKQKVYVILDMHAAPGGQSPWFIADPAGKRLWESDENQKQTMQLWTTIANRYKNESIVAGYDLLNEPDVNKSSVLVSFYQDLIKAIRSADNNHLLIAEGNKLAKNFSEFPEKLDGNQIYSYHYYAWFGENSKEKNIKSITQSIKTSLPLWCGEWGEDTPDNLHEVRTTFNRQNNTCGTAFWTWKRVYKNNSRLPFYTVNSTAQWNKIMSWVTWKIGKPSKEQVQKAVKEFLSAIQIENCTLNQEVKAAISL